MGSDLGRAVETFPSNRIACAKKIRDFVESNPEQAVRESVDLLKGCLEQPGLQHLLLQLYLHQIIFKPLCDPALFTLEEAVAIARKVASMDPRFEMAVWTLLSGADAAQKESRGLGGPACLRLLEIVTAVSNNGRSILTLTRLLRHPDYKLRSKAALLLGKIKRTNTFIEPLMADKDPRVRANAIESMWGVEAKGVEEAFWCAVSDSDNRVAGNALYGLYQLGAPASIGHLTSMAHDTREEFRNTAVWVMSHTGDPRFLSVLSSMVADPNCANRSGILRAMAKLNRRRKDMSQWPALALQMLSLQDFPDRTVDVCLTAGAENLKGTGFALWEDTRLVEDYDVRPETATPGQYRIIYKLPPNFESAEQLTIEAFAPEVFGTITVPRTRVDYSVCA
jgi:hypothetical protein